MASKKEITLRCNNVLTNDPCHYCGERCDPDGFDFFAEGTDHLVCFQCAIKFFPGMVRIKTEAMKFAILTAELGEGTPTKRTPISKEVLVAFKPPPENPAMDRKQMGELVEKWERQGRELAEVKARHEEENRQLIEKHSKEYREWEKTQTRKEKI